MTEEHAERVRELQAEAPEAAQWAAEEYLRYDAWCALEREQVVGLIVFRRVGDEAEVIQLAVSEDYRRRGVGRTLLGVLPDVTVWLEVRGANAVGRAFYGSCGFEEVGERRGYYRDPDDSAIVMVRRKW
jgi:ribosomal-protein-alanine N-acetyltransferase